MGPEETLSSNTSLEDDSAYEYPSIDDIDEIFQETEQYANAKDFSIPKATEYFEC